jgi:hypothetical protein
MAATTAPLRRIAGVTTGLGNMMEEVGSQLAFYLRIIGELCRFRWVGKRYRSQMFAMISDITIGASALIVGGGMVFVILSMSFFTGTDGDVGHEVEHHAAVLPLDLPVEEDLPHHARVEAQLAADLLEAVAEAGDHPLRDARDGRDGGHQNFCGTSAK